MFEELRRRKLYTSNRSLREKNIRRTAQAYWLQWRQDQAGGGEEVGIGGKQSHAVEEVGGEEVDNGR